MVETGRPPQSAGTPPIGPSATVRRTSRIQRAVASIDVLIRDLAARPMARGAFLSVVLTGLGAAASYLTQIFVSRMIGVQQFGQYAYVLGLLNIARIIVTFSLDIAAIRFVGVYYPAADWSSLRGFVLGSRAAVAGLAAIGAVFSVFVIRHIHGSLPPGLSDALVAGAVLIIPASLLSLEVYILQGLRRVAEARVPNLLIRPILLAAGLYFAVHVAQMQGEATVALYAHAVGIITALLISFGLTQRLLPEGVRQAKPVWQVRQWSSFCVVNLGQNIVYLVLSQQADVVIVGSLLGTADAGLYAAASLIASLVLLGVSAVNQFTAPLLAEFHDRRTDSGLRRLLAKAMLLNAVLSLPLIAIVVALGPVLLASFGPAFVAAYPVIVILAAGCVINALWGGLWGDLLTMIGLQKEAAIVVIAVTLINLGLTVVLTPRFGMAGAAYSTTTAVLVRGLLLAVIVRRRLGFWPWTVW